jgi:hypothetical protein
VNRKPNLRRYQLHFILAFIVLFLFACIAIGFGYLPARASLLYGPPAASLSIADRIEYSARLLSYGDLLKEPHTQNGPEQRFRIEPGETVFSIATRLYELGLVSDSQAFFDYVVYTGLDLSIQAGEYTLSSSQSIIDIAKTLQKFSPSDATLVILSGWRMEEIAASLPTSGLSIDPQAFISAAQTRSPVLDFLPASASMEGFFYPDSYTLPRTTTTDQLLDVIARNFVQHLGYLSSREDRLDRRARSDSPRRSTIGRFCLSQSLENWHETGCRSYSPICSWIQCGPADVVDKSIKYA